MDRKLPYSYNGFVHPVIRYKDKVYSFAGNGHLLELSDKDGTWINTYRFKYHSSSLPVLDEETLYFINTTDDQGKIKTLYAVNLDSRQVLSLFTFTNQNLGKIVVANNKVYFLADNKIFAVDRNGAASSYEGAVNITNFIVEQTHLIACSNNYVQGYDLKQPHPIWQVPIPYPVNYNVIVKNNIVYLCAGDQLMLLSIETGTTLEKLTLPFTPAFRGAIMYHENKILISGDNTMMIIENK